MKISKYIILLSSFLLLGIYACDISNDLPDPATEIRQQPKISVLEAVTTETDEMGVLEFTVELSWDFPQEVKVNYSTIAETAEADKDFVNATGTITFAPGETTQIIRVEVIGENAFEGDETLKVELSNPVNGSLLVTAAVGTIKNDDDINEIAVPVAGFISPESYAGMELVWQDEFNGDELNPDDWVFEIGTGNGGWGNNELQYYREENTSFIDGNLVIEARKEAFGGREYTSSRFKTQGKKSFRFGRVDLRAVLPEGQGIWPALWMLGTKISAVGWPACGEIDIMELVGHQANRVHSTVHFGTSNATRRNQGQSIRSSDGNNFSEKFHVFSLVWKENTLEFLVDDEKFFEFDRNDVGSDPYPFNDSFFFIFNVAVGGNWPGSPDATTNFPQRMFVDYVRVFQ